MVESERETRATRPQTHGSDCWAASLGGCVDKMSREHLVSQSMWSDLVDVHGLPWCKDAPKRIGIASLTQKMLCRSHNSDLSPVDTAGTTAFGAFGETADLAYRRSKQRPYPRWKRRMFRVDGPLLERWFLKTTINLVIAQDSQLRWALTGERVREVPSELVKAAFGVSMLSKPMGLYSVSTPGERITVRETMEFSPLIHENTGLVGGLFTFRGHRFLIYFSTNPLPQPLTLPGSGMPEWKHGTATYRLPHHQWKIGAHISHRIDYGWPDVDPPASGLD